MPAIMSTTFPVLIIELAIKSFLLVGVILSITWFMRRSSAAVRHLLLAVTTLALIAMPAATVLLPSWSAGLLPDPFQSREELRTAPSAGTTGAVTDMHRGGLGSGKPMETSGRTGASGPVASSGPSQINWPYWLVLFWVGGALVLFAILAGAKLYGILVAGRAPFIEQARLLGALKEAARRLDLKQEVILVQSDRFKVPTVFGIFQPRLLLPSRAGSWPEDRLKTVLHHELAHIKRRDILVQLLAQVACCIYWLNPLVWILERRLFIERERACDDMAMGQDIKASDYAGHLMEVLEELGDRRNTLWVTAAMAEGTDFKDRILSVLNPAAKRASLKTRHAFVVVLFVFFALFPLSVLRPWAASSTVDEDGRALVTTDKKATRVVAGESLKCEKEGRTSRKVLDERSLRALIDLLNSPDAGAREHAASAIGNTGDRRAVQDLIDALDDENARVREHVTTALGRIGDDRAVKPLIDALRTDTNDRVREHAASALGWLREDAVARALVESMQEDKSGRVRAHAAYALGNLKSVDSVIPLIEALKDEDPIVRAHAAEALGTIGDPRASEYLLDALDDPSERVRKKALLALTMISE
jgi:beta-lactamase regulating signal transducer with metallopeptidase domain